MHLPLSTILPNRFFPLKKFLVEQFHLLYLNWCWHSATAMLAPFATAASTPGFSLASRRCFLLSVACTAGSMYRTPGDNGDKLFGSPALAIPLSNKKSQVSENHLITMRNKLVAKSGMPYSVHALKTDFCHRRSLDNACVWVPPKTKSLANLKNKQRTNAT